MLDCLIVVDVQNDFLPGGALAVARGDEVVSVANALMPVFRRVIATQDWHPRAHGSFAANHSGRAVGEVMMLGGADQVLWPVHCVQETDGAAFAPELDVGRIGHVVRKGTDPAIDSYSGFFDNDQRKSTGLEALLRAHGEARVWVLGLATDYCVKATALDALRLGFKVTLVVDGCRAVDLRSGDGARAFAAMQAAGVALATSAEVLADAAGAR